MNGDILSGVAIALVCVLAVGVSATTLDATITTDPEDGLDFDDGSLPVRQEDADALADALETAADEVATLVEDLRPTDEQEPQPVTPREPSDADVSDLDLEGEAGGQGRTPTPEEPQGSDSGQFDPLETLLDLPRELLVLLPVLGPFVVVVGYRYADRLATLLASLPRLERSSHATDDAETDWSAPESLDDVSRAWFEMVRQADVDRPRSKTPEECARVAIAAGMDSEAVETITRAFEEVRYGGGSVTDERRHRVRHARRQLGFEGEESE